MEDLKSNLIVLSDMLQSITVSISELSNYITAVSEQIDTVRSCDVLADLSTKLSEAQSILNDVN